MAFPLSSLGGRSSFLPFVDPRWGLLHPKFWVGKEGARESPCLHDYAFLEQRLLTLPLGTHP